MRDASTNFKNQLETDTTTLARLWRVTPIGRTTLYYTDHDKDITYDGHAYTATDSFAASAIENKAGTGQANFEITVLLADVITKAEVEKGIYGGASVEVDAIFYDHVDYGVMPLATGQIVDVSVPFKSQAIFSCSGFATTSLHYLTETYSPTCRAEFCDERCGLDEADFTATFEVTAVTSTMRFEATGQETGAGRYNLGYITWTSGANIGKKSDVQASADDTIRLLIRPPFPIEVGDEGTIVAGCDKTIATCRVFDNAVNFRGEPFVPGTDFVKSPKKKVPTGDAAVTPPEIGDGFFVIKT